MNTFVYKPCPACGGSCTVPIVYGHETTAGPYKSHYEPCSACGGKGYSDEIIGIIPHTLNLNVELNQMGDGNNG